jgi:hypothetical protein
MIAYHVAEILINTGDSPHAIYVEESIYAIPARRDCPLSAYKKVFQQPAIVSDS